MQDAPCSTFSTRVPGSYAKWTEPKGLFGLWPCLKATPRNAQPMTFNFHGPEKSKTDGIYTLQSIQFKHTD